MTLSAKQFQSYLLRWFDKHGRKNLAWQQDKTPYRVWVSEIMLQQTQVSTVIPYYERFMQAFPDIHTLATANEDEVLHLWAGLGYYSRARNLHHAAKLVVEQFAGVFPDTQAALVSLPGIGQSTAGAILSIAFNQPATILDGNVKRVLARLHAITDPINEKATENTLWNIATSYTPKNRTADYTQAIMDLGATLCTRSKPNCTRCPFTKHCLSHEQGIAAALPYKTAARELPIRTATFIVLKHNHTVLLQKRPAKGIWGGLWSLPELSGLPTKKAISALCKDMQVTASGFEPLPSFRHTFSHYHLDIFPVVVDVKTIRADNMEAARQIWYNPKQPAAVGLPKPVQLILRP